MEISSEISLANESIEEINIWRDLVGMQSINQIPFSISITRNHFQHQSKCFDIRLKVKMQTLILYNYQHINNHGSAMFSVKTKTFYHFVFTLLSCPFGSLNVIFKMLKLSILHGNNNVSLCVFKE